MLAQSVSLFSGATRPHKPGGKVALNALATAVSLAEIGLGERVPLLGTQAVEANRLGGVTWPPNAHVRAEAEAVLPCCKALRGGQLMETRTLSGVGSETGLAVLVHDAELRLREGQEGSGGAAPPRR